MKLNKQLFAGALAIALALPSAAFASKVDNKFYAGVDGQFNIMTLDDDVNDNVIDKNLWGVGAALGYRWTCLGLEVGYTHLQSKDYMNDILKIEGYNVYLDGYYYHELTKDIDFKAMVGVGRLETKAKGPLVAAITGDSSDSEAKVKPRAGLGLQYNVTENFSVDAMYKYQSGNSFYTNMNTFSIGAKVHI